MRLRHGRVNGPALLNPISFGFDVSWSLELRTSAIFDHLLLGNYSYEHIVGKATDYYQFTSIRTNQHRPEPLEMAFVGSPSRLISSGVRRALLIRHRSYSL